MSIPFRHGFSLLLKAQRNSVKGDGWSEASATAAARAAAALFGLAGEDLELVRLGTNANFRLGAERMLRVARPEVPAGLPAREVAIASELARLGVPAVSALEVDPVDAGDYQATLWRWEDHQPLRPAESARALGALLRQLHSAGVPDRGLPRWDGLVLIDRHLDVVESTGQLAAADVDLLRASRSDLAQRWSEVGPTAAEVAVHGDLHFGNVLRTTRGLLLADLETFALGPPEVDLVPVMVGVRRFGLAPRILDDLLGGYGWEPEEGDRERLEVACRIRALLTTTWLASLRPDHPDLAVRLEYWRSGATATAWRAS